MLKRLLLTLAATTALASPALASAMSPSDPDAMTNGYIVFGVFFWLCILASHFIPIYIAFGRGKIDGKLGVTLVNILLGWTVIGWIVALVWACTGKTRREVETEEKRHHEMMLVLGSTRKAA